MNCIVNKTEKEGEATTLTLAPTMPVVLASVETNSSDTRFTDSNSYLYFLNFVLIERREPLRRIVTRTVNMFFPECQT